MMKKWKKAAALLLGMIMVLTGCNISEKKQPFQNVDFAMGTVITQNIYGESGEQTANQVLDLIKDLEKKISWRIDSSDVSAINRAAGTGKTVPVGPDLRDWITACREVCEKSEGAFDLTVGPASRLWDIGGENPHVASKEEISKVLPLIDGNKLYLVENSVQFDIEGGQLDLGAVGKGIACDVIREYLEYQAAEESNGTFSAGGSVLIYGQKPNQEPWKIGIQDPRGEDGSYMGALTFSLAEDEYVCVSTSGDYEKYIEEDGVRYHHILDPKTGAPAESDLISVTVISKSGLLSDALSTACFVAGKEKAVDLAAEFGAEVILIDQNKKVTVSEGAKELLTILTEDYQTEQ